MTADTPPPGDGATATVPLAGLDPAAPPVPRTWTVTAETDDRDLIRAHVAGHPQAFTELVRRHRDRLWAVALRTMSDRQEAEDALQDALISAFRNAHSYRGEAAVTTWLHRVVVNACLDRVRRRQARPTVAWGDREVASRRDEHSATEARLDVRAALALLPEGQRAAIVLVDMEEVSVAEAATMLGVAEGTVKSRCSRGRAALAVLLRAATGPGAAGGADRSATVTVAGNRPVTPRVGPESPTASAAGAEPPPAASGSPPVASSGPSDAPTTQGGGAT